MTKKLTKKEMFAILKDLVELCAEENKDEMLDFINHEVELLNRKSSNGSSKKKNLNEVLMDELEVALAEFSTPITITDFMNSSSHEIAKFSNQKLSALMKKLVEERKSVERTYMERKARFFYIGKNVE